MLNRTLVVCTILGVCQACGSGHSADRSSATPPDNSATLPADSAEPTAPAPLPSNDHRPLVVAFGDSLSAGFGADPGKSFPDFLQALIDQDHRPYRVYNAGVSGDTTTDGVSRLAGVIGLHPKIVILEFGGNDGLRGIPVSTTKDNLGTMIVRMHGQGIQVLLAAITLPRNYGPDFIRQFDAMYIDLADIYHVKRIPFLLQDVATDPTLMQQDSIHPTAEGNRKVAATVFRYLKPML